MRNIIVILALFVLYTALYYLALCFVFWSFDLSGVFGSLTAPDRVFMLLFYLLPTPLLLIILEHSGFLD